jgi:biotin operon repressor
MVVKERLENNFYLPIISFLETSTNLTELRKNLSISKQDLNYYLRQLKKRGMIIQKGRGWYESVKGVKNSTKYDKLLSKDISRGHAFVWEIKLPQEIKGWERRIDILKEKSINFKLVGAKLDIPRIKVLGRKVWLCKDHLRVFDKKEESYYGKTAKEARNSAFNEVLLIVGALESKLGILFNTALSQIDTINQAGLLAQNFVPLPKARFERLFN